MCTHSVLNLAGRFDHFIKMSSLSLEMISKFYLPTISIPIPASLWHLHGISFPILLLLTFQFPYV